MPAITRIATNLLYFSNTLGDYLSHSPVPVQRHNSHLGFVRRHFQSLLYLGFQVLLQVESYDTWLHMIPHVS